MLKFTCYFFARSLSLVRPLCSSSPSAWDSTAQNHLVSPATWEIAPCALVSGPLMKALGKMEPDPCRDQREGGGEDRALDLGREDSGVGQTGARGRRGDGVLLPAAVFKPPGRQGDGVGSTREPRAPGPLHPGSGC